jgi:beta-glucosidase
MKCNRVPLSLTVLLFAGLVAAAEPSPSTTAVDQRVEKILSQMTLEEKVDYVGGYNGFQIRAIPRLGVPEVTMADGPLGVRNYGPSNYYPAGISMAATWDIDLENRVGKMIGVDARARGVHIMLAPGMNIHRAPMCGRNFEYFGEDPFLASRMAVAVIKGMQSQGVMATAKHFVANNQEWDRHHISSDIDERTLREIYLPAFEASVKEGQVGAIMDSYNLLNGVHMTQNGRLNTDIARKEWGFRGIMMSDWDATYDGIEAANNGLDLEMPSAGFMNRKTLLPAVKAGKVAEKTLDEKVARILRTLVTFGFFDRPQKDPEASHFNQEGRRVALEAARGGMVLLKNNGLLPLDKTKAKRIAVIGPRAQSLIPEGGGSGHVNAIIPDSFLDGISKSAGPRSTILYSAGTVTPNWNSRFAPTADGKRDGLVGEYFNNPELRGPPALTRTDQQINFRWSDRNSYGPGGPISGFSVRWTGYYTPRGNGEYTFFVAGGDGVRLFVDDKVLIDHWHDHADPFQWKSLVLEGGTPRRIRLEYSVDTGTRTIRFGIASGKNSALAEAKEIAAKADAVILCVGFDAPDEGESFDRTFTLPEGQDDLIRAVTSANKNVAVVLTGGGNVDMSTWLDSTAALLHAWYPGQEGGAALGEILFGDVNPSGKLPVSFERRWPDNPTHRSYYDATGAKKVAYSEGIFVGYRHYDRAEVKPLFPFGHGLSYTTFRYRNLTVSPPSITGDEPVRLSFDVTNAGKRAGAEIAEVYVSDKHAKVARPIKELKGFSKSFLKPGETKRLSVVLDRRAFSYYDIAGKQWKAEPGDFDILVGSSSDKIELRGKVRLVK